MAPPVAELHADGRLAEIMPRPAAELNAEVTRNTTTAPGAERLFGDSAAELLEVDFRQHVELLMTAVEASEDKLIVRPPITVYGRLCQQPRDVGFFSDHAPGYAYGKQFMAAQPLGTALASLLETVNLHFGASYNGVLVNRYRDGRDNVGSHADSLHDVDPHAGVVALSYGATRTFRLRNLRKEVVGNFPLRHGFAMQMAGAEFQQLYRHEVPIERRIQASRVSFTFRRHLIRSRSPKRRFLAQKSCASDVV